MRFDVFVPTQRDKAIVLVPYRTDLLAKPLAKLSFSQNAKELYKLNFFDGIDVPSECHSKCHWDL